MRVLFVWSAAEWSVFDVARGFHDALVAAGHEVYNYRLYNRIEFAARGLYGLPGKLSENQPLISRLACEGLVVEALANEVEVIILASAVAVHPNGVIIAKRAGFPVAVLHTESPYEDENQAEFSQWCDVTFTHERFSAERYGWHYLPHAYDPAVHHPVRRDKRKVPILTANGKSSTCDVLMLGTGWPERTDLLAAIDWTGIDLRILGVWPDIKKGHPLERFYTNGVVDNKAAPRLYAASKICLNFHRNHPRAESLNPRAYEIAACGGFQLSDPRAEVGEIFGDSVPTFTNAAELQHQIRHYLAHPAERKAMAERARLQVQGHTFTVRAAEMINVIQAKLSHAG